MHCWEARLDWMCCWICSLFSFVIEADDPEWLVFVGIYWYLDNFSKWGFFLVTSLELCTLWIVFSTQLNQLWELIFLAMRLRPLGCDYNCWREHTVFPFLEREDHIKFTGVINPFSLRLSAQQYIFIIDNFQQVTWQDSYF